MTHRLATNYAKNYCNRTLTVKVIVENVVTCFFGGHSVVLLDCNRQECNVLPVAMCSYIADGLLQLVPGRQAVF